MGYVAIKKNQKKVLILVLFTRLLRQLFHNFLAMTENLH
ncbi:hypothetical protein RAMDARK_1854 [Rickettsia amblyommatis str. Darkwater]|nr:hypothetical protein RAMDARK_1854 [Rickettsia amblyommatis str. Darkwater]